MAFMMPKQPAPPPLPKMPKPPQVDQAQQRAFSELDVLRRRGLSGSSVLTSEKGLPNLGTTKKPALSGSKSLNGAGY